MRELPVNNIVLTDTRRWINSVVDTSEFICYDTETYKGKCKLLCDSQNRFVYNPTFKECLDFLFYRTKEPYFRAFYNIDFDISAILKLWNDIDKISKLIKGEIVYYDEYSMFYIRPKLFRLSKDITYSDDYEVDDKKIFKIEKKSDGKRIYIVDLYAMFKRSLNSASKEFLNDEKFDVINSKKLNTDIKYWVKNLDDIIKYCKQDASLTARVGNKLIQELKECNLLIPKYFTSHASLSKQYFRYNCRIPSLKYIPTNILDIALSTYYGGRFEVLKRGYFDQLYSYDINSAYPETICMLPSFKYGKWNKVKQINDNETIGFYKVVIKIPQQYISAMPIRLKNKTILYASGIFATWITWYEADLLRDYIKKVVYGYEYSSWRKEYFPYKDAMNDLYKEKLRNKYTNEVFYWLVKLTMNSLYGCFIERHRKSNGKIYTGILFNSVYASIITARTRWKLLKDVGIENYHKIVAFHTDSVITTEPLNLTINDDMGNWSIEAEGFGVILKSGIYQIADKIKRRCFSSKKINWIRALEWFGYTDIIKIPRQKVIKIAESLRRWNTIERVNEFIKASTTLKINTESKREWNDVFKNCNDLLSRNISSKTKHLSYINELNLV